MRLPARFLFIVTLCAAAAALCTPFGAQAEDIRSPSIQHDVRDGEEFKPSRIWFPYAFYAESFDFSYGLAGGVTGYGQEQMGLYGAVLGTANDTYALFLLGTNIGVINKDRLFLDTMISTGYYTHKRDYLGVNNPGFPEERAGSNDSSEDNYIVDEGWDTWGSLRFKYVLPIGDGRESGVARYTLDRGILLEGASGGERWNPLRSGRTLVHLEPFFRYRSFEFSGFDGSGNTNGLEFSMIYDNRDFSLNPERGSSMRLGVGRDFGLFDSRNSWTVVGAMFSKYLSLGRTERFRQRVLAFNAWTTDNTTWDIVETEEGPRIKGRAAPYKGSTLGGYDRMRAYPINRFHDKAAIYYCAELRLIPDWNPVRKVSWLNFLDVDWLQAAGFFEVGRVAPEWDVQTLHEEMKWDAGFGVRAMARKVVVRFDVAFAEDSWGMWAMAGQPF